MANDADLAVRVPAEVNEALDAEAEKIAGSRSTVVRIALMEWLRARGHFALSEDARAEIQRRAQRRASARRGV